MSQIVLFHSVLGVRPGVLDAAERLRADGHQVLVPDLLDGRVFDEYEPAMRHVEDVGELTVVRRGLDVVSDLPDGFVTAGFSMGGGPAVYVATQRRVAGVLMLAGAFSVQWLGDDVRWPSGVPAQIHYSLGDPFREQEGIDATVADVQAAGGQVEVFDYPGDGHLFTDASLPDEYDAESTELMWSRVLGFLRGLDV